MSKNYIIDFFQNSDLVYYLKDDHTFRTKSITMVVIGAIVVAATIMFYLRATITDPNAFGGQMVLYGGIVLLALVLTVFDPSGFLFKQLDGVKFYLIYAASFGIMVYTLITYYNELSDQSKATFTSFTKIFLIAVPIIALAIFFIVFKNFLKTIGGWSGFFIKLIFYLPCLLIDLIEAVKRDIQSTTNTVLILFVLELLFLFVYFYSNYLIQFFYSTGDDKITLLSDPVFLNRETKLKYGDIYSYEEKNNTGIKTNSTDNINSQLIKHKYNANYSVSMWIYVNSQETVLKDFQYNIFNYARGKPQIVYINESSVDMKNNKIYLDKIKVNFSNRDPDNKATYTFTMPKQKWNNIVINYNKNIADLFLNGVLIKSVDLSKYISNSFVTDSIIVGSTNNLNGGICNINYYPVTLTQSAIINNYNLLANKNPPIN
jgi:hypothetical protein